MRLKIKSIYKLFIVLPTILIKNEKSAKNIFEYAFKITFLSFVKKYDVFMKNKFFVILN